MVKLKNPIPEGYTGQTQDNDTDTGVTAVSADIPAFADKILKMYPQYPQLAIDAQGGVYTGDVQLTKNCKTILYQNPYYKPTES